jgi:hypothetical protein
LCSLYLHGHFTERYVEYSDVNGNHLTADAAGLVFAGLFFEQGAAPRRWQQLGWDLLCSELPRQVSPDGVDFEGSLAYHRLVLELFLLPALFRESRHMDVPPAYKERLIQMARFAIAYSRSNGTVPLIGDADDGRALPMGGQPINDHRYLAGLVGSAWDVADLKEMSSGPVSEVFWLLGGSAAETLTHKDEPCKIPLSSAFPQAGFYVMRNDADHIFVDCAPVGLAGRGGHGHNDCLAFEAVLDGVLLVSDCGSYVYTASYDERNRFRSTAFHNTPQVDGKEINRFVDADDLWHLNNDAHPEVRAWKVGGAQSILCATHSGYRRLSHPVAPVRTIILDHCHHALVVQDSFESTGEHKVEIPLHLGPTVLVEEVADGELKLRAERDFRLCWGDHRDWTLEIGRGRCSPSYGITVPIARLAWHRTGALKKSLVMILAPYHSRLADPLGWAYDLLKQGTPPVLALV